MGNFTNDAFWTKVSKRVRWEMADSARDALIAAGTPEAAIPWPAPQLDEKKAPDLPLVGMTLVRRIIELTRELHAALAHPEIPRELAKRTAELIVGYQHVGQDLWNTIAGDRVWDKRLTVKPLKAVSEGLQGLNGLKHECNAIATTRSKKLTSFDHRLVGGFLKKLEALEVKLAKALAEEEAPAKDAPAKPAKAAKEAPAKAAKPAKPPPAKPAAAKPAKSPRAGKRAP